MGSTSEQPVLMQEPDRRLLWGVRATVLLSMLFLCVPLVPNLRYEGPDYLVFILLVTLPIQLPYLLTLARLRTKTVKKGLSLAFAISPPRQV